MKKYSNKSGKSGVLAYEILPEGIRVKFVNGSIYEYTISSAGSKNIALMEKLAEDGKGLSTFISTVVKDKFA